MELFLYTLCEQDNIAARFRKKWQFFITHTRKALVCYAAFQLNFRTRRFARYFITREVGEPAAGKSK